MPCCLQWWVGAGCAGGGWECAGAGVCVWNKRKLGTTVESHGFTAQKVSAGFMVWGEATVETVSVSLSVIQVSCNMDTYLIRRNAKE